MYFPTLIKQTIFKKPEEILSTSGTVKVKDREKHVQQNEGC